MKEVLKEGQAPNEVKYQYKCNGCGCEFTYQKEDLEFDAMIKDRVVSCPGCRKLFLHQEKYNINNVPKAINQ